MMRERRLPRPELSGPAHAAFAEDVLYEALGVRMHALGVAELNDRVVAAVHSGNSVVIGNHNLHSVHLARTDPHMKAFYRLARWTHIDGMPLIFVGRLLGYPFRRHHRVTYVDWADPLLTLAARHRWRVFFLGSTPESVRRGRDAIEARYALEMETHHGYFDAAPDGLENGRVRERIRDFDPDLLLVGMGMPRQERWVVEKQDRIGARVIITCGAMMDYIAGTVPTPPRWMGRAGLEWLYRLAHEPRRLFARYLMEPWSLVAPLARDVWHRRIRPAPSNPQDTPINQ
jgi:N-acetylglucosaminyldiphosphoundecaprenol N-acetyl-beta-D-mannosaminyltransferase